MQWLKLAFLNVLRNRRRSLITILIAAVGTSAVLISGGFGLYTYESLRESAARDQGHLTLAHPQYYQIEEESVLALGLSDYEGIQRELRADPSIRAVLPRIHFSGLLSNGEKTNIFSAVGLDADEFSMKGPFLALIQGRTLSATPDPEGDFEVMLGEGLARSLGADVGAVLTVLSTTADGVMNAVDLTVTGIFSVGVPELDKRLIYTHLTTAQTLLVSSRVSTVSIYLGDTEGTASYLQTLEQRYPELGVIPWWDQAFYYQKVKGLYDRIFGILGAVIAVLVFFSVSNTLSMSVMERTREIGTLAALGSYPGEIMRGFVLEALIIALVGALTGILIAALATLGLVFLEIQMPPPPGRSVGYPLYIYFSPALALMTTAVLSVVCCGAAWLAARKGVNRPIVEALSHD